MANVVLDNGALTDTTVSTKALTGTVHVQGVELVTAVEDGARADLAKAEDAGHTSGDMGLMALAVRKDTAAALATTDSDYIPLIVDDLGRLHVAMAPKPLTFVTGNQSLTISTTAVALTVPSGATHALITCEDADVRFWINGTPTASAGHLMVSGQSMEIAVTTSTRFIRAGAVDGELQVSYFKYV